MRAVLPGRPRVTHGARIGWTGAALAALIAATSATGAGQQHAGAVTPADIEAGSRLYSAQCAACHGADGNQVPGVDLRQGRFRRGSTDEDLTRTITQGVPGTAMTAHKLAPPEVAVLIAYLRSMNAAPPLPAGAAALPTGDPTAGRVLVEGRGCLSCHRIEGKGSRQAVDLSDIGGIRTAAALDAALGSISTVAAQRRFVRAVTADGRVVKGRRLNEDTFTVQILDDQDRLVSLSKAGLREYQVTRTPPAPVHAQRLEGDDRSNIVAYLFTLKGLDPGPQRGPVRR